jgi:hypothetical protein
VFFEPLLRKPYLNQVVASPHVYGPSITKAMANFTGAALYRRLTQAWGYLNRQGYCSRSNPLICHRFPIAIGEFGSFLDASVPGDLAFFRDLAPYLLNRGTAPSDGTPVNSTLHNGVSSWFWFAWNANSGDTGGIAMPDYPGDWGSINWNKIDYLISLGLSPWYLSPAGSTVPLPEFVPSCSARFLYNSWVANGQYFAAINIIVSSTGVPFPTPWTVDIVAAQITGVTQTWNWEQTSIAGGVVRGTSQANQIWQTLIAETGNAVNFGFIAVGTNDNFTPQAIKIGGVTCSVL